MYNKKGENLPDFVIISLMRLNIILRNYINVNINSFILYSTNLITEVNEVLLGAFILQDKLCL